MESKYKKVGKYLAEGMLSIDTAKTYLHSILANCREVIYRYNFQTQRYDYISNSIETLTGYTPQEIKDQGINYLLKNLHSNDKSAFMDLYFGLLNSKVTDSTVEIEYRIRHKNGTYIWQDDVISIIRDESGKILATVGAIRDITQQKERERELQASKERFKRLSVATFEGICIHDNGQIIDGNQNLIEMFGLKSVDEFIGTDCFEYVAPECHELVKQKISTNEKEPYEVLALRKDGTAFPIQVRARDCQWNGKPVRIATFRDLTKQKQREKELKATQERYKMLSEATYEAVCIHENGIILDANQRYLELYGFDSIEDLKGSNCYNLIAPQCREDVMKKVASRKKEVFETFNMKTDGTIFPVLVHANECYWQGRQARIVTIRDLTEEKDFEQQLKRSRDRFKHLFESAPDAIFIADVKTGIIAEANCKAAELLGIPVEKIVGMHQSKLHPPEEAEKYKAIFCTHIQSDVPPISSKDIYVQHKDGRKIPIQINASIISINDQKFIYGIFRDITNQKKLMDEIAARETHFKQLSNAAFEAIVIQEKDNIVDVNQQYLDMFGYSLEEVKAIPSIEMIAPQSRDLVKEKVASKYEGAYEAFCIKKDGTIFPVEIQVEESAVDGKSVRIAAIRDMTIQKQLLQDLADSEAKYKELYENAKAALYRTRIHDGKLLACNMALAQMHGYNSAEECLQKHHGTNHYVNKNRRKQLLNALHKNKRVENFEYQIRRPDGTKTWLSLTAEIFPEKGWIEGVVTDITPFKSLTPTEMKILKILLTGKSNKEIAFHLGRSIRTIEDHRSHIMRKLGVDNVVDMTRKALECGIKPDCE